ncbi:hypothetical protein AcV7_002451 [Taiwanofungus camphoratus]|nr:hypothetical protein AcV7_002451 [Antrodia cinnamomea]
MGASLEPVVGLLRILKRLIQVTDPKFSELLDRNAPLPYFALSNLLTLLSHDVPTLPLIQHVFDYLLCRHPIAIVYLAAAVVLSRREEVYELEKEGEEGMTHSLLSSLPELYEDAVNGEALSMDADDIEDVVEERQGPTAVEDNKPETSLETALTEETKGGDVDVGVDKEAITRADASLPSYPSNDSNVDDAAQSEDAPSEYAEFAGPILRSPSSSDIETSEVLLAAKSEDQELPEKNPLSASFTSSKDSLPRSRVSLTSLFTRADELYSQYLPSHPSIAVSSIMGPQSIMLTWSENPAELPDDDDAELMVTKPELIVLPYIEPEDEVASDDDSAAAWGKRRRREYEAERRRRRKLRKPRRLGDMVIQRKTMVVGAVLVLGVAMAVYGIQAGGPSGPFRSAGDAHHHRHDIGKEWKRVSQFVGGALLGMGERVFDGLWH